MEQAYEILVHGPPFPIQCSWQTLPINTSVPFSARIQVTVTHSTKAWDCFLATPELADL